MKGKQISRTLSIWGALTLAMVTVSPGASASDDRTIIEPTTNAVVIVSGEGSCDDLAVKVSYSQDEESDIRVEYDVTDNCYIENVRGVEEKDGVSDSQMGTLKSTKSSSCNWIHSSQTVQDVVNIDIAKHRLNTRRCWNGSKTWMTKWNATSSTSAKWNHTSGKPTVSRFDTGKAATATTKSAAKFHTDWTWCNFKAGWQSIELRNTNVSKKNGGYKVTFWQNRSCPGTHMATASKVNNSSGW